MTDVKHIKHQNIDFTKWDNAVLNSQIPFVFAQSFYLNATCPNWDALVIGDYESVFPLTHKTKFGFRYLPQPPFTSQLGTYGKLSKEIETAFYNYVISNYKLVELELNITNQLKNEFISPKNTYYIDYKKEYKFNQNSKRNIAKALDVGFVVKGVEPGLIISLSKKYLDPFLQYEVGLTSRVLNYLHHLLENAMKAGTLKTFQVLDKEGNIRALGHFLSNGKHTLYLKGTNFDRAENSGSMHLLIKHAIDFFADKSEIFDFGGGSKSEGLANFYKGFGGEPMTYSYLRVNNLPRLIKLLKNKN